MSAERLIIEKMFTIPDKDGKDVDFILNPEQAELDANLTGRDIIAKARQMGFSTYVLGLFLARCLMYRNRRCVLVSHSTDATQKLLGRIHYVIKHMKGARPELKYANQNYITFSKMDSSIYVGTAGSGDFGVGDTISDLHCSEVSRWANPAPLLSGLFQAVPTSGNIILESTGRGTGNYFHRSVMKAKENDDEGFKLHFFNWLLRPEYSLPMSEEDAQNILQNPNEEYDERKYIEQYQLTPGQIKWRRRKIAELDYDLQQFKEQYPVNLDECFQATGNSFFQVTRYFNTADWIQEDAWTQRLTTHPKPGLVYAAGVDVAGGVGLDNSVLEIFEVESGDQVLEFVNKRLEPAVFAQKVAKFCQEFNAYVNFERNNHGYAFSAAFIPLYNKTLIHRTRRPVKVTARVKSELEKLSDWGSITSHISKPLIVGKFRTAMRTGTVTIHSQALQMECTSFVENAGGEIEAAAGCLDDRVMASALAVDVFPKAATSGAFVAKIAQARRNKSTADTFRADSLIAELEHRYQSSAGNCPVGSGLGEVA